VSLWLNLELVATAVLGHWFFRDHLTRYGWLGVGMTLVAAMALSASSGSAGVLAGLLVLLACCCWGLDNHLTALIDELAPSQSTFWKGLVAGSVSLAIGLMLRPFTATGFILLGALFVGIWSYGASITLYIHAAQRLGATRGQVIFSTAPFFGLLLSAMLLDEPLYDFPFEAVHSDQDQGHARSFGALGGGRTSTAKRKRAKQQRGCNAV
jgi:drug/metabolite transporter (DMT)-like permease